MNIHAEEPSILKPDDPRRDGLPVPESPEQLSGRIQSDLDAFHAAEKDAKEYASKVQGLWDTATHQKRMEVEHAMHPRKQRR